VQFERDQTRPLHTAQARSLRRRSTWTERYFWRELRKLDANFRRQGPIGPYFADFACYLLPLAVLELYLYAQHKAGPGGRFAMAGGLVVLTALMAVGMFGFSMFSLRILAKV